MDDIILAVIAPSYCDCYQYFQEKIDNWINTNGKPDQIISGELHVVERYAYENQIPITFMYPNHDSYGKSAEIVRNRKMLKEATHLVAFIDKSMNDQRALNHFSKELNVSCTYYYTPFQ